VWYFFNDVYPTLHGGHRPFDPPRWWRRLFERNLDADERERPGPTDAAVNQDFAAAAAAPEVR
jgi:Derlin-2/3